ncbi:MAG: iron-sulfur cluster assembly scaffold protein [Thermoplasmata archaeon]|jgi:nitrogen fixation NifU-like protein|nr:iron-sulfur cluster assembly scaffold protein [Thermoplasmata archaeon]
MSGRGKPSELDILVENIVAAMEAGDSKIYSKEVIAEFRDPANVGPMDGADGTGLADGLCMDTMQMWVKVEGGRVSGCTFYTDGCGATIACGSRLTKLVRGLTPEEACAFKPESLVSSLGGLPEEHVHCASLAVIAFKNAMRDAMEKGARPCGS